MERSCDVDYVQINRINIGYICEDSVYDHDHCHDYDCDHDCDHDCDRDHDLGNDQDRNYDYDQDHASDPDQDATKKSSWTIMALRHRFAW